MDINVKAVKIGSIVRDINQLFKISINENFEKKYLMAEKDTEKGENLISSLNEHKIKKNFGTTFFHLFIYDYNQLNQFAKAIIDEAGLCLNSWIPEYIIDIVQDGSEKKLNLDNLNDLDYLKFLNEDIMHRMAIDFIEKCNYIPNIIITQELFVAKFGLKARWIITPSYFNRFNREIYIFWALMILAVDKNNAEKHLNSICDFAEAFDFSKEKLEYIANVVKVVFEGHLDDFNPDLDEKYRNIEDLDIFNEILIKYGSYNFK